MLDTLVERLDPKVIVEIGAYYGGWTLHLDSILADDARIFSFQSPIDARLNHIPDDTSRGEYHYNFPWKPIITESWPKEYHGYFDFNLLARNVSAAKKATLILDTSPLAYDWNYPFDLCTIDISPEFAVNEQQFAYWSRYVKQGGIVAVGAYSHQQEMVEHIRNNYTGFDIETYSNHYVWAVKR